MRLLWKEPYFPREIVLLGISSYVATGRLRCDALTPIADTHVFGVTWTTLRVSEGSRKQTQASGWT